MNTNPARFQHLRKNPRGFEALDDAFRRAVANRGTAVIVTGENGVGKTLLCSTFLQAVEETDCPGAYVRCRQRDANTPYAVIEQLVRGDDQLRELMPAPIGQASPAVTSNAELLDRIVSALNEVTSDGPFVLIVDDVHWADTASVNVLERLMDRIEDTALLVVLVTGEADTNDFPSGPLISRLIGKPYSRYLAVEPATLDDIKAELRVLFPEIDRLALDRVALRVLNLTRGNRMFLFEILRNALGASGADEHRLTATLQNLPDSVRVLLRARLDPLSTGVIRVLQYATLLDEHVDLDLLTLIVDLDQEQMIDCIDAALDAGVLIDDHQEGIRFSHGLMRETILHQMSSPRRRYMHQKIADDLWTNETTPPAVVAEHAVEAGNYRLGCEALLRAGQHAATVFAIVEAVRFFERAIDLSEETEISPQILGEIHIALGDAVIATDRQRSKDLVNHAATLALIEEDEALLLKARVFQAKLAYNFAEVEATKRYLDEVFELLQRQDDQEVRGVALTYRGKYESANSEYAASYETAQELYRIGEALGHPMFRSNALSLMTTASPALGFDIDTAPGRAREAVEIMATIGLPGYASTTAWVAFINVDVFCNLHNPADVQALVERGMDLDWKSDRLIGVEEQECTICSSIYSYWWFLQGEWERARRLLFKPELCRAAPIGQVLKDAIHWIAADMAISEHRISDARELLDYVADRQSKDFAGRTYRHWITAVQRHIYLDLEQNNVDEASRWLEKLDAALQLHPHAYGQLALELCRARLNIGIDQSDVALVALERLTQRARALKDLLMLVTAQRLMAVCMLDQGIADAAFEMASQSIHSAQTGNLRYEEALSLLTRAEITHLAGNLPAHETNDFDRATLFLETIGAEHALKRAQRLMQIRKHQTRPGGLTARESDVLQLLLEGRTDAEIAERLFISPRTVGTHVSNMFNKTDTSNRVELATWAIANNMDNRRQTA